MQEELDQFAEFWCEDIRCEEQETDQICHWVTSECHTSNAGDMDEYDEQFSVRTLPMADQSKNSLDLLVTCQNTTLKKDDSDNLCSPMDPPGNN